MENKTYALLFGNDVSISSEEKERVLAELNKIGSLTFSVFNDKEGWTAQCNEVSGIIAGGTNPTPSKQELESSIRDSIYAAFEVKMSEDSPYFTYNDLSTNNS